MPWDLTGNANINEATDFVGTTDGHSLVIKANNTEGLRVDPNGNVGVGGASDPSNKLQINAQDGLRIAGYQPYLTLADTNAGGAKASLQNANGSFVFYTQSGLNAKIPSVVFNTIAPPSPGAPLPSAIEVHAQYGLLIVGYQPYITLSDGGAGYQSASIQNANGDLNLAPQGANGALVVKSQTGNVGVGTSAPSAKLEVIGDAKVSGDVKVSGDIQLAGNDCAEHFELSDETEPGTVLVIDDAGFLKESCHAYDKKVAGVVSGAGEFKASLLLGDKGSYRNPAPVALIGRVCCKADASYGAISVGDLLTTSTTPGHAMKAADMSRAFGCVIGKALRPLTFGKGIIPILVAMQ